MATSVNSPNHVARLRNERDYTDRVYNDALTALDHAIQRLRELPDAPPRYDEHQLAALNERWQLLTLKPPSGRRWTHRLRALVWGMVAPIFERQQDFNAALVDHFNRNVEMHRQTTEA